VLGVALGIGSLGGDGEASERGFGEGVVDGAALVWIIANGAIFEVLLNEQNFGADALEADDARGAELAAVEADVVGADAGRQAGLVDEFGGPFVDFEPELALFGVPIEVEVAGEFLRVCGFFGDGGRGIVGAKSRGMKEEEEKSEGKKNPHP